MKRELVEVFLFIVFLFILILAGAVALGERVARNRPEVGRPTPDAYTQGYARAADSVASAVEWRRYDAGFSRGYVAGLNRRDTLEVGR